MTETKNQSSANEAPVWARQASANLFMLYLLASTERGEVTPLDIGESNALLERGDDSCSSPSPPASCMSTRQESEMARRPARPFLELPFFEPPRLYASGEPRKLLPERDSEREPRPPPPEVVRMHSLRPEDMTDSREWHDAIERCDAKDEQRVEAWRQIGLPPPSPSSSTPWINASSPSRRLSQQKLLEALMDPGRLEMLLGSWMGGSTKGEAAPPHLRRAHRRTERGSADEGRHGVRPFRMKIAGCTS
jgi:hypothetical protein